MKPKHKRMALLAGAMVVLAAGAGLVLSALGENIMFFHAPSDVVEQKIPAGRRFRIGGLVAPGSVKRTKGTTGGTAIIAFKITDGKHTIRVAFKGILPDLFREGQGVVAQGALRADGTFLATEVLAKHDENYMPPEVAAALKKSGHRRKNQGAKRPPK